MFRDDDVLIFLNSLARIEDAIDGVSKAINNDGKEERKRIAAQLMAGLMANGEWYKGNGLRVSEIAEYAIAGADELMAQLEQPRTTIDQEGLDPDEIEHQWSHHVAEEEERLGMEDDPDPCTYDPNDAYY